MLRTQIYLPENLYQKLLALKKAKDTSLGKIIREVLEKNIGEEEKNLGNDLLEFVQGGMRGGIKDASVKFNQYLYEKR